MSKHLRQGDRVITIAGNDKGKTGKILSRKDDRVVVEGINVRKKHVKRTSQTQAGTIIEREMPFHISNVSAVNESGAPVKLKVRFNAQNEKELFYKDGNKEVLFRAVKTSK
jgi:large subunit ribosomal protein L24